MPDSPQPNSTAIAKPRALSPLFVIAAVVVVSVGVWLEWPRARVVATAVSSQARIFFPDPDDYMRSHRARLITTGQAWRVRNSSEINFPAGAELHWTTPMDYLLAGAAILFGPLTEYADPLAHVATWVPICLGVFYVICMIACLRRGFGWGPALLAGLMVVCSPAFHRVFAIGHPDHHCLLELLLLIALGAWIPRARPDGSPGEPSNAAAVVSGLAIGLAIWVATLAAFWWVMLAAGLSYACLFGPPGARQAYAKARLIWNWSAVLVVAAGFLVENWPELNAVAVDKISTVHLALLAIGFLAPCRLGPITRKVQPRSAGEPEGKEDTPGHLQSQTTRHISLLAAIAAFVIWIGLIQNQAFEHVGRAEFFRWSEHIVELQPLYTRTLTDWSIRPVHARLGFLPYALPLLVLAFIFSKQVPRPLKCTLGLAAPAVMILTIMQRRWLDHFNLAITPVAVVGMWELSKMLLGRTGRRASGICFIPTAAALAILMYLPASGVVRLNTKKVIEGNKYQERTDFVARHITKHEAAHPSSDPNRRAILCEGGEGPMLLYCTGLPVVATPYHRALDGLLEAARFFAQRDPDQAREQLDRLGVRYVVMPPRAHEQLMQFEKIVFGELRSFDAPTETINKFGGIMHQLNYRPEEIVKTMAYRLVMEEDGEVIPGVERIAAINEGAATPDGLPMWTGLLYVVNDLPAAGQPASAPVSTP